MWEGEVEEALESRGYKLEFEYGEYDYSWNITKVFSKDGRVFSLSDSGCSCSHFGEFWSNVDQIEGDLYEVTSLPPMNEVSYDTRKKFYDLGVR